MSGNPLYWVIKKNAAGISGLECGRTGEPAQGSLSSFLLPDTCSQGDQIPRVLPFPGTNEGPCCYRSTSRILLFLPPCRIKLAGLKALESLQPWAFECHPIAHVGCRLSPTSPHF